MLSDSYANPNLPQETETTKKNVLYADKQVLKEDINKILKDLDRSIAKTPPLAPLDMEKTVQAYTSISKIKIRDVLLKFQEKHFEEPNIYACWKNILESQKSKETFNIRKAINDLFEKIDSEKIDSEDEEIPENNQKQNQQSNVLIPAPQDPALSSKNSKFSKLINGNFAMATQLITHGQPEQNRDLNVAQDGEKFAIFSSGLTVSDMEKFSSNFETTSSLTLPEIDRLKGDLSKIQKGLQRDLTKVMKEFVENKGNIGHFVNETSYLQIIALQEANSLFEKTPCTVHFKNLMKFEEAGDSVDGCLEKISVYLDMLKKAQGGGKSANKNNQSHIPNALDDDPQQKELPGTKHPLEKRSQEDSDEL